MANDDDSKNEFEMLTCLRNIESLDKLTLIDLSTVLVFVTVLVVEVI